MTLFDPNSHIRLHQLRQERLALKHQRRNAIRLDDEPVPGFRDATATMLRALAARIATNSTPERQAPPSTPAHPEAS